MALGYEYGGGGSGGFNGQTSIGGVSAVNPQAKQSQQSFIDQSYNNARRRLNPQFGEQNRAFDQKMANQGISVGSDAYNRARGSMQGGQNDAYMNAAFGSEREGRAAQQQDFMQDATRSGLANQLLTSRWNTDLGYAGLGEQGRQFDNTLGYNYDKLGQNSYEFDANLDKQYYDTDSQFDYMYDRADQDDYRFGVGQDRTAYLDDLNAQHYDDAFMMQLLGLGGTPGVYTQDPSSAYSTQISEGGANQRAQNDMINKMISFGP